MAGKKKAAAPPSVPPIPDGKTVIKSVLSLTSQEVADAKKERAAENAKRVGVGKKPKKPVKEQLTYSIRFAKHMGAAVADALRHDFPEVVSGEIPSHGQRGPKRVDVRYSTPEMGLGFAISFKSVHVGEQKNGDADFIHNMKRNDEELRVEATGHHLRQPYAVLASVLFLPFEACDDALPTAEGPTSSFAAWVEYLWPLHGRTETEDPPDRFELVFVALYARDGSDLGFYEVGGKVLCPRRGQPSSLLKFSEFLRRIEYIFVVRNGQDFYFEGEAPPP